MSMIIARSDERIVHEHRDAIIALADLARLGVSRAEVEAFFLVGHEFVLAFAGARLVGFVAMTWHEDRGDVFLGYMLAAVHPNARGHGLLGKMAMRYFLAKLPALALRKLTAPWRGIYVFADVSNPVSYRRLRFGMPIHPDLRREGCLAASEDIARLRARLGVIAGIAGLDPSTGLIDGGATGEAEAETGTTVDVEWARRWRAYVPPGSDLLVVIPLEAMPFVRCLARIARIGATGRADKRPRGRSLVRGVARVTTVLVASFALATCGK